MLWFYCGTYQSVERDARIVNGNTYIRLTLPSCDGCKWWKRPIKHSDDDSCRNAKSDFRSKLYVVVEKM